MDLYIVTLELDDFSEFSSSICKVEKDLPCARRAQADAINDFLGRYGLSMTNKNNIVDFLVYDEDRNEVGEIDIDYDTDTVEISLIDSDFFKTATFKIQYASVEM